MFTLADFERARNSSNPKRGILESLLFDIQKSDVAYALNLSNNHFRGHYAEKMLQHRLEDSGFDVVHYGETHDYDLLINGDIKAEVKLATIQPYGKKSTQYVFHKIKPECFDVIFFVFLNPNGLTTKWTDSNIIKKWSINRKRGKNGYQLRFDSQMQSKKITYDESFEGFIGLLK